MVTHSSGRSTNEVRQKPITARPCRIRLQLIHFLRRDLGHHPSWDEHHPVHFVGHSAGVQVARVLQQMLAEKVPPFPPSSSSSSTSLNQTCSLLQAFSGYDTSEDWVLSITSLSGAINGTIRTYYDGMR